MNFFKQRAGGGAGRANIPRDFPLYQFVKRLIKVFMKFCNWNDRKIPLEEICEFQNLCLRGSPDLRKLVKTRGGRHLYLVDF